MVHKFIDNLFEIEGPISQVIKHGFIFSLIVCLISGVLFYFYTHYHLNYIYHEISLILFKSGITFAISFFICGIATNKIKNDT